MIAPRHLPCALAAAAGLAAAPTVLAQPVPVILVAIEGQELGDGITMTGMGDPYVNALGQVGFI